MRSAAGQDAQPRDAVCPTGLVFVPSIRSIKDMIVWIGPFIPAGVVLILLLWKYPVIALYLPGKFQAVHIKT
jgi:hypothetical protein